MELVELAKNPVPSGALTGFFKNRSVNLRFARWEATRGPQRGTVCVFPGRGEFIEKYFEVVADLRRRGFAVAVMDWRGQGGSDRLLSNPQKGHVRSFADFDKDLACFMREVVAPHCPQPYIALAHSMGGHILLRNAVMPATWFSRMVLSAPMIAIEEKRLAVSRPLARAYVEFMASIGAGSLYVPGGNGQPIELGPFDGNPLTSDADRYARNAMVVTAAPRLGLGSPTVGWLRAALRSCARLDRPDYPLRVQVPLLLFAAGLDTIVSTTAIEEFARRLKIGTHVLIPQSRHEILQETDAVRRDFWATFDAFMGVDAPAA